MKIEDVITEVIVAIYSRPTLSKLLILKGGSAMRMFDDQTTRLSIDADFSIESMLIENAPVFQEMEQTFVAAFSPHGFDLIDFHAIRKPKKRGQGFPEWWCGWS
jgi:hypothetical protein